MAASEREVERRDGPEHGDAPLHAGADGSLDALSSRPGGAAPPREDLDPFFVMAKGRLGSTVLGKWHLDALLGVGGMAAVYSATHRNGSHVAVKMLHPSIATAEAKKRFLREGYLASSVGHPGVVQVLDDDIADDGAIFLVMELLEGESLEAYVKRPGKISPPDALAVGEQILEVLAAAHGKGIVHRDVKPENVFLCKDGRIKLLDFGIARLHEATRSAGATHHGFLLGTPAFMAPEQARGDWERVDGRTDVWSVGASLFRVLTGRTVHQGESHIEILMDATTTPAPRVRDIHPQVPDLVASLVDRALSFSPDDRWSSAEEMLENLRAVHRAMGYASGSKLRAKIAADTTVRMELPRPADERAGTGLPLGEEPTQVAATRPAPGLHRSAVVEISIDVDDATQVGGPGAADTARDGDIQSIFDDTSEISETVMDVPRLSDRPPPPDGAEATLPALSWPAPPPLGTGPRPSFAPVGFETPLRPEGTTSRLRSTRRRFAWTALLVLAASLVVALWLRG